MLENEWQKRSESYMSSNYLEAMKMARLMVSACLTSDENDGFWNQDKQVMPWRAQVVDESSGILIRDIQCHLPSDAPVRTTLGHPASYLAKKAT